MKLSAPGRSSLLRCLPGLSLAVVALAWLPGMGQAWAKCASEHGLNGSQIATLFPILLESGALGQLPQFPELPNKPCSGPSCSQGKQRPFSTTPSIQRLNMEEWALPAMAAESTRPRWVGFQIEPSCAGHPESVCTIFHPPRCADGTKTG